MHVATTEDAGDLFPVTFGILEVVPSDGLRGRKQSFCFKYSVDFLVYQSWSQGVGHPGHAHLKGGQHVFWSPEHYVGPFETRRPF